MGRLLPLAFCVVAILAVLLLPAPGEAKLAALKCSELFDQPIRSAEESPPTLAEFVLESPAVREREDGNLELELFGMRMATDDPEGTGLDLLHNLDLRRSVARAMRQAASDRGRELVVLGEQEARPGQVNGASFLLQLQGGEAQMQFTVSGRPDVSAWATRPWKAPNKGSLVPPLVAVVLAVLLRKPLLALFAGILAGAFLVQRGEGAGILASLGMGLVEVFRGYFWPEFTDPERAMIIAFVAFMLAMVGVMTRAGGIQGLMDRVADLARNVRRTQIATFCMGLVVFFDDYANTILVGATMRPLTDRFKIAREKLAYIVDSTAAPVAGLSIFSTWIAFEVSTFNAQLPSAGMETGDGYAVFLRSIPYSFYCIFTLVFVGLIVFTGRDFGPMLKAEQRARSTGRLLAEGSTPMVAESATSMDAAPGVEPRAWRAAAPLLAFLVVTLFEILRAGGAFSMAAGELFRIEGITSVLYAGSGSRPLMIGAIAGFLVAAAGAVSAGLATDVPAAAWKTLRAMWVAFAILYLAWMIGRVCKDELGTAPYLTAIAVEHIQALWLPTLLFVLSGVVAFATGSSWATMSILMPLVVALAYELGVGQEQLGADPVQAGQHMVVICIAAVLSGAIFGDHCSPISDTTVMSSIASASDHIDHVKTQAPYAVVPMSVSILAGYIPCTFLGVSPVWGLLGGTVLLYLVVRLRGRPVAEPAP